MRVNRVQLRQAVTDAMAAHKARHEERVAEWDAAIARHRDKWVADHNPAWAETAKLIARKVKAGKPIESDDLPKRERYSGVETYDVPHSVDGIGRKPDEKYTPPYELAALGAALDVVIDDEISHTSLEALGITKATFRDAVAYLGRGAVTAAN